MKTIIFSAICTLFLTNITTVCYSSDILLMGETKVEAIRFPDNSLQLSATVQGPPGAPGEQGPQGIQGIPGVDGQPGLPAPSVPARILYTNKLSISDFQPVWLKQCLNKTDLSCVFMAYSPSFSLSFTKLSDNSILRVGWSDNVGIYNNSWCNIGLFIDDQETTACSGAWSGITGTTVFNQQNIDCIIPSISSGAHTLTVKHRSQYCVYGNYAFDNQGSYRLISVEEQN